MFLSIEELKKMKKDKYSLPNDEIFVPRMLKTKVIFYFYSNSYTGFINSQFLFLKFFYNYYQALIYLFKYQLCKGAFSILTLSLGVMTPHVTPVLYGN